MAVCVVDFRSCGFGRMRRWILEHSRTYRSNLGGRSAHDGIRASFAATIIYSRRSKRQREQGRDLGAIGHGLHRGSLRHAFGDFQRLGSCGNLYGPCGGAKSGERDADGNVGGGWDEDGYRSDYGNGGDTCCDRSEPLTNNGERGYQQ